MGKTNRFSKAIEGTGMEKFLSWKHNTKNAARVWSRLSWSWFHRAHHQLTTSFISLYIFLYRLRNKGILTYWLGFLPYWNDEKTLKFILGMLVRKKTSGYVCLMASLTSFKTSSEAVSSMTTKHPIGRFKSCSTTRITSWPNGLLETSGVIYPRTKRRASKTLQRSRQSKFSILRSRSSKLR